MTDAVRQQCIHPDCGAAYGLDETLSRCSRCGNLLDVRYDWSKLDPPRRLEEFDELHRRRDNPLNFSGVWRFRRLAPFAPDDALVTIGEGQTLLRPSRAASRYAGLSDGSVHLQYEGLNPSGSFKDNGMSGAFSHAKRVGATVCACASTGNTSASLGLYSAELDGFRGIVFIGAGKIALGKLAQALEHGVLTLSIEGDFDDAMVQVQSVCRDRNVYLVNSLNPFRLEGQKTIMYRVLEALRWEVPDWIVVPGGNLGNSSAFGKAYLDLAELGLVDRLPRLAIINASGADTLHELVEKRGLRWNGGRVDDAVIDDYYAELDASGRRAKTLATAIQINRPVNLKKALRALDAMNGVVRAVDDQAILDAKAEIGRSGLGCEPASAATLAGLRELVREGTVGKDERVVCILTGHVLKDPTVSTDYHTLPGEEMARKYADYGPGVCQRPGPRPQRPGADPGGDRPEDIVGAPKERRRIYLTQRHRGTESECQIYAPYLCVSVVHISDLG